MRPFQSFDVRRERPVLACEHDGVPHAQLTAVEDNVDGFPHPHFVAHFQHGALGCAKRVGEAVFKKAFGQSNGNGQQILQPFTLFGRHGHEGNVLAEIFDLVVALKVETVFGELPDGFPVSVLEQRSNILSLCTERFNERTPGFATPAVEAVDFVSGDDERRSGFLEDVQRLDGLRLKTFHDVDDQNGNVRHGAPTVSKRSKGMMPRCVDEQQSG